MRRLLFVAVFACSRTVLVVDEAPEENSCDPCDGVCITRACVQVKQVIAAGNHTCVRLGTGKVACWGENDMAILGTGKTDKVPHVEPAFIASLDSVDELAVSETHACVISRGKVLCWGSNATGELGHDGTVMSVAEVPGITGATHVGAGKGYTCVNTKERQTFCFGEGIDGQLDGAQRAASSFPVPNPASVEITRFALGPQHGCAISAASELWCWGSNNLGQQGIGFSGGIQRPHVVIPLGWVTGAAATTNLTCATRQSGVLACWGLGLSSSSIPSDTGNAVEVQAVTLQSSGACVLKLNGAVRCGEMKKGDLDGITFAGDDEIVKDATEVTLGRSHGCALTKNHRVSCWGKNSYGQLGDGTTTSRAEPFEVVWP